ncbi:putative transporter SVOPL isoform X1 [Falco rusticolus]|uniref:putative transporter SVOPL isoform X1 n=1 Tax=Falco cherrug TaxID=345164 RepID=UPI000FFC42F5|nr:putative transporter SVOPL isoform X1 [Falco cherrug]XP_027655190.1 putative transporter SVOPL isoform X1 [Falco cherrug]XP_037243431.1 putative transporter SVOPL isoform X1 [Falco rusticolus]XP_037243432.1 putative transporter SVOPL isoform X1 [Falco rusticolus]XP_037243433.1 putative transporter SVOPL isoform X1 [Falco rusticolus]
MAAAMKEAENVIGLEEIHMERQETPKGQKTFTVEEAVETIGFGRFHIMLFLIMGSTGVAEAMEIMLIAVVSPLIRCEWQLQDWQVALVTTVVFFGYMVFSIVLGLLADRYGRWKILLLSFLWAAYFSLLTSFAPSYIWFVFLRAMVGGGVSGHAQGLIIKTEFLPSKYRGYMLPLSQVFWLAGSLLIIGLASVVNPTIGWRWLIRTASIPGILLILVFKFIPESARYNVSTGNVAAALATLQRIAKTNGAVMPEGVLREPAKERRGRFKDLIHPKYLRTTLQIWIIWLGIAFAYYGVILASAELLERDLVCGSTAPQLQDSGDDPESHSPCHCHLFGPAAYQTMIISTVGEIALNPLNVLGINFLGRRLSLCITMGCTALFFLLLNICTSRRDWVSLHAARLGFSKLQHHLHLHSRGLSHHDASTGSGNKWVTVPCWSYGGPIYITSSYECFFHWGPVSFLLCVHCLCDLSVHAAHRDQGQGTAGWYYPSRSSCVSKRCLETSR